MHRKLGPGLLESDLSSVLLHEIDENGLKCQESGTKPIIYDV